MRALLFELQCFPGDGDLDKPAFSGDFRFARPDSVPGRIVVPALVGHFRFALGSVGIGDEIVGGPVVVIGVEHELEIVVVIDDGVAPHFPGDDFAGFGIITFDADVEVLFVIEESHLGFFGCRSSLLRLTLGEIALEQGILPGRIVKNPVYFQGNFRSNGRDGAFAVRIVEDGGILSRIFRRSPAQAPLGNQN